MNYLVPEYRKVTEDRWFCRLSSLGCPDAAPWLGPIGSRYAAELYIEQFYGVNGVTGEAL